MISVEAYLTWTFNQHVATVGKEKVVYAFLTAIVQFGYDKGYRDKITSFMISNEFLTSNIRSDTKKPNLWRDYQQYLADLGLIYSTEIISEQVRLTPIALMFLAGEISFTDLMGTQSLRFQYPNGQKDEMPYWAETVYASNGRSAPTSSMQPYLDHGILIRPGLFILQCLIGLAKNGEKASITVDEALAYMVIAKVNSDWTLSLEKLIKDRRSGTKKYFDRVKHKVQLRHVSEWFRQLGTTSFCTAEKIGTPLYLRLNYNNEEDLNVLSEICKEYENIPYWIPDLSKNKKEIGIDWFSYYGSVDANSIIESGVGENLDKFIPKNDGDYVILGNNEILKIKKYDYTEYIEKEYKEIIVNINNYKAGREKLEHNSLLHDRIVFELAKNLGKDNYLLSFDNASADLVAKKGEQHVLFEVKTVTRKKAGNRIRLGVGQLSEYRFRYERQNLIRPDSCIVISSEVDMAEWYKEYFSNDIKMGLIARVAEGNFKSLIPAPSFEFNKNM